MSWHTSHTHHRHLIDLAALLGTAGLADLFADMFGRRSYGADVLVALGAVLVVATVAHHLRIRRHAPPSPATDPMSAERRDAVMATNPNSVDVSGRDAIWRIRAAVQDTPGRLAVLAGALAACGANILSLQVHPIGDGVVVDDFIVLTPKGTDSDRLAAAIAAVGGSEPHVTPADLHALVDAPTQALNLATRLGEQPNALPAILAELLGAEVRTQEPAGDAGSSPNREGEDAEDTRMILRLGRPSAEETGIGVGIAGGEVLIVSRPQVPFTATEYARAHAMVQLAAVISTAAEDSRS